MAPRTLASLIVPGTDDDVVASYEALGVLAADAVWGLEEEIAFIDLETTGFDPTRDAVIEVGVVVSRGPEVLGRYSSLVDPGRPIPRETTVLTGISDADIADAPPAEKVIRRALELIGERDVVAHNCAFDRAFVEPAAATAGIRLPGEWLDSLQLARIALPRLSCHRLADLAEAFGLGSGGAAHRAGEDAEATFRLWRLALAGLQELPAEVVSEIAALWPDVEWPMRKIIAHAAGARSSFGFDLAATRKDRVRRTARKPLPDAHEAELVFPPAEEIAEQFAPGGAVERMYPGFEPRAEQVEMATAVLAAFEGGEHLAVEAGTGVGKSVAYLLPAAKLALASGIGVGVATKTNALTDQLVYRELPALCEVLGGKLRYAALKGYDHYPCLRKLDRELGGPGTGRCEGELVNAAVLLAWTTQTGWGDTDTVNVHWEGRLRQQVSAGVEECARRRCRFHPQLCYLHGIRRRAASAHVVVTNHALLFRDAMGAGGILPPIRYWVIDEAHSVEDEARKQMSLAADSRALGGVLAGLAGPRGVGGLIDSVRGRMRSAPREPEEAAAPLLTKLRGEAESCGNIAGSLWAFVKELAAEAPGDYDTVEIRVTRELRAGGPWADVERVARALARHLDAMVETGRRLVGVLEEAGQAAEEVRGELASAVSRLAEQAWALTTIADGEDPSYAYSLEADRRPQARGEALHAYALDIGETLSETLLAEADSVVFTSATIAAGDDFSHFARSVGLDRLPGEAWRELRLRSSYDMERQMSVFVAADLPEPGRPGHLDAVAELLRGLHLALGGSVLTLFTNRRDLDALYRRLAPGLDREGLKLIAQTRGSSAKRVAEQFVADERMSLFATKSFWEGFDAKGDTLRCVTVAKLPFGVPTDPVMAELKDRDPKNWWAERYLPEAILELKQAAGRLIRSSTDEGCIVIADSRLASSRPYAREFARALPVSDVEMLPAERVLEEVERRFGRT